MISRISVTCAGEESVVQVNVIRLPSVRNGSLSCIETGAIYTVSLPERVK